MKHLIRAFAAAALAAGLAAPVSAGEVKLSMRDGRVTLQATDASPREILAEWARVGRTRIVNAERVTGPPMTVTLDAVPEAKALDMVLRSVGGYVAAPRAAQDPDASHYDRIVVMAVARPAVGVPAPPPPAQASPNIFDRQNRGRPQPMLLDDQDEPVPQDMQEMPSPTAPQPGMPTAPSAPESGAESGTSGVPGMPTGAAPTAPRPGMPTAPPKPPGGPGGE